MDENNSIQLFEDRKIRTAWDEEKEEWYFSVVDVIAVLTDQPTARNASTYWAVLKKRLKEDEEVTQESGFGVVNVNQRIHSYYGEEYGIFYESREGKGTKVTVVIPAKNVRDVVL